MAQEPDTSHSQVRGLLLPGLKRWRVRRGLSQQKLADRVGARLQYISRVEQGRGCNGAVAQRIADVLGVDLQDLRSASDDEGTSERVAPPRYLHKAYLQVLLEMEVGSAYLILEEQELGERAEELSVEEVVWLISRRRQELQFLEGLLASDAELHPQVRLFLEELVRERPGEDIRVLVERRTQEFSAEGQERLTHAMRELL
jgi:transcriptional regulator with XRE-family HTH domain